MRPWGLLHSSVEAIEETAEAYVLGTLPPEEERSYERHLLICTKCQDAVEMVDEFIEVFRAAVGTPQLVRRVAS